MKDTTKISTYLAMLSVLVLYCVLPWQPAGAVDALTVDMDPECLNLNDYDEWLYVYIELTSQGLANRTWFTSVTLNETISAEGLPACLPVGDYDSDTIPDLKVTFNSTKIAEHLIGQLTTCQNVTWMLNATADWGFFIEGNCTMRVSNLVGDIDCDGVVGLFDAIKIAQSYGSSEGDPDWNPRGDVAPPYGRVDIYDLVTLFIHYGDACP